MQKIIDGKLMEISDGVTNETQGERLGITGRLRTGRMVSVDGQKMKVPDDGTRETLLQQSHSPADRSVYWITDDRETLVPAPHAPAGYFDYQIMPDGEYRVLDRGESPADPQSGRFGRVSRFITGSRDNDRGPKSRLVIREDDFARLRSHLLREDGNERAAFALLGKAEPEGRIELYLHRLIIPDDGDYCEQSSVIVEPKVEFVLETMSSFASSRVPGYLHMHSHPFCSKASFSCIDTHYFPGIVESLRHYLVVSGKEKDFIYMALVWGHGENGYEGRCLAPDGSLYATVDEIRVVGRNGIKRLIRSGNQSTAEDGEPLSGRFHRQVEFLGVSGQRRIQRTSLAVCGVGGLGSFVVACAKGLGFREMTLIDPDVLDESNLNRFQGGTAADVGRPKVDVVSDAIKLFDPAIKVNTVCTGVEDPEARKAIVSADFIINCLDDDGARIEVQILAALHLKPLLDLGSGIILGEGTRTVQEMGGQAVLYYPGGPCLFCQGIDPTAIVSREIRQVQRAAGYIQGTDETPPSVVTINAVLAGLGLQVAIDYVTGFAEPPSYLHYDVIHNQSTKLAFTKRPDCPICSETGIEGRGEVMMELPLSKRGKISLPPARITPVDEPESSPAATVHGSAGCSVCPSVRLSVRAALARIKNWLRRESRAAGPR